MVIYFLEALKIHFFTYSTKASRLVKYVLKHFPNDFPNEEIKTDLTVQGAIINEVSNLRTRDDTISTCFLVSTSAESVALLQKVTKVLFKKITFEPYRRRNVLA